MPADSVAAAAGGPSPRIAIAGFKQVYDPGRVESALGDLPAGASDALRATYEKMIRAGGERLSVKPAAMPDLDAMAQELPKFSDVIDDLRKQLALCLETQDPLEITPMLLLGDPGIGKTHFARRLADLLGTGHAEAERERVETRERVVAGTGARHDGTGRTAVRVLPREGQAGERDRCARGICRV